MLAGFMRLSSDIDEGMIVMAEREGQHAAMRKIERAILACEESDPCDLRMARPLRMEYPEAGYHGTWG